MGIIDDICNNFNDEARIEHDCASYQLTEKTQIPIDYFEKHRENYLFEEVIKFQPKRILDVGCGIGHLVMRFLESNIACYGIDIAENMIKKARHLLSEKGLDPNVVSTDNLLTYKNTTPFDTFIANGVIWYYPDKTDFLKQILKSAAPKAHLWIVHRNDLFNLFALNEGTLQIFLSQFLSHLTEDKHAELKKDIISLFPNLNTPIQSDGGLIKPYDNPFTIHQLYEQIGFKIEDIHYTYIHPAPPRFKKTFDEKKYAQLQKSFGKSWIGAFLGSQFIVHARCP